MSVSIWLHIYSNMLTALGKLKEARHTLGSRGYHLYKAQSIWCQGRMRVMWLGSTAGDGVGGNARIIILHEVMPGLPQQNRWLPPAPPTSDCPHRLSYSCRKWLRQDSGLRFLPGGLRWSKLVDSLIPQNNAFMPLAFAGTIPFPGRPLFV